MLFKSLKSVRAGPEKVQILKRQSENMFDKYRHNCVFSSTVSTVSAYTSTRFKERFTQELLKPPPGHF